MDLFLSWVIQKTAFQFIKTFETDHSNPIYSILNQIENNNYESFGSYDF